MDPTQKPPQKSYKFQILIKHFINIAEIAIKHAVNHVDGHLATVNLNSHISTMVEGALDVVEIVGNTIIGGQTQSLSPKQSIKIMYVKSQKQITTKAGEEQTSIKGSISNKRKTSTS